MSWTFNRVTCWSSLLDQTAGRTTAVAGGKVRNSGLIRANRFDQPSTGFNERGKKGIFPSNYVSSPSL